MRDFIPALAAALLALGVCAAQTAADNLSALPTNEYEISLPPAAGTCPAALYNTSGPLTDAVGSTSPCQQYIGARSLAGMNASTAIDAFNYCRYVNNGTSNSIFVPFNTLIEWDAFLNNAPPGIVLRDCSIPGPAVPVPPNFGDPATSPETNICANNPPIQTVPAPYYAPFTPGAPPVTFVANAGTPLSFACNTAADSSGTAFTETAVATLQGIDSGSGVLAPRPPAGGWKVANIAYGYAGICGTYTAPAADGSSSSSSASSSSAATGLCLLGTASAVTTDSSTGEEIWTCTGPNTALVACTGSSMCGIANGQTYVNALAMPKRPEKFCATGTASPLTTVMSAGGYYATGVTWTCTDSETRQTANCNAAFSAGICGTANGSSAPSIQFFKNVGESWCAMGTASPITATNTPVHGWTWTCTAANINVTSSCRANYEAPTPVEAPGTTNSGGASSSTCSGGDCAGGWTDNQGNQYGTGAGAPDGPSSSGGGGDD